MIKNCKKIRRATNEKGSHETSLVGRKHVNFDTCQRKNAYVFPFLFLKSLSCFLIHLYFIFYVHPICMKCGYLILYLVLPASYFLYSLGIHGFSTQMTNFFVKYKKINELQLYYKVGLREHSRITPCKSCKFARIYVSMFVQCLLSTQH